jgi:hypothetical protein
MPQRGMHIRFWWQMQEELDHYGVGRPRNTWEDNIKMNLRRGPYGLGSSDSGWGLVDGSCEHDNETSGSIKWEIRE